MAQNKTPAVRRNASPALVDEAAGSLSGLARIAAGTAARSAAWTLGSGVRSGRLLARALTNPAAASELVQGMANDLAEATRTVSDVARAVSAGVPLPKALLEGSITLSAVMLPDGFGVVSHLVVGVLGAVIGGVLVSLAVPGDGGLVGSIVVAVAGAVVLLLMLRLVSRSKILADD